MGGHLRHSNLCYEEKHPIILPIWHHVTELIAKKEHIANLHCGPQELLFHLSPRCGEGGSTRACHSVSPGSIPGRDKFPG